MSQFSYSNRRATGIVVTLQRLDDGKVRIVFDDVERTMSVDAMGVGESVYVDRN